jgi:hypothetical protein
MSYPTKDVDESHEAWQKAMARCNAQTYLEKQALVVAQAGNAPIGDVFDTTDIDDLTFWSTSWRNSIYRWRKQSLGKILIQMMTCGS